MTSLNVGVLLNHHQHFWTTILDSVQSFRGEHPRRVFTGSGRCRTRFRMSIPDNVPESVCEDERMSSGSDFMRLERGGWLIRMTVCIAVMNGHRTMANVRW